MHISPSTTTKSKLWCSHPPFSTFNMKTKLNLRHLTKNSFSLGFFITVVIVLNCGNIIVNAQELGSSENAPCAPKDGNMIMKNYQGPDDSLQSVTNGTIFCVDGMAGEYPCHKVDLVSHLSLKDLGYVEGSNDIWGWVSPTTAKEYVIYGTWIGTAFLDIDDPENPIFMGGLPKVNFVTTWFDMKVYKDHAFVVSEAPSGMQVFDLTQLDYRENSEPKIFNETTLYTNFSTAHNIAINEETGFAYVVGSDQCNGGLYIIDINDPGAPSYAGCYSADGYTHDVQCVIYNGPHEDFVGKEICFACNEDSVTIIDVTDKSKPCKISKFLYRGSFVYLPSMLLSLGSNVKAYTHQGWLTDDQRHFIFNDELDRGITRTYVMDIQSLTQPKMRTVFCNQNEASDHNLYIVGQYMYQANYRAGLRILDIAPLLEEDVDDENENLLEEVAFFDIYPSDDEWGLNGAWSNYPFFPSGLVAVSGIEQGFYLLRPHLTYEDFVWVNHLKVTYKSYDVEENELVILHHVQNFHRIEEDDVSVTVTIHDHSSSPVGEAIVTGMFFTNNGNDQTSKESLKLTCVTDYWTGECEIVNKYIEFDDKMADERIHFDVVDVHLPNHRYESNENKYSSITFRCFHGGEECKEERHKKTKYKSKQPKHWWRDSIESFAKRITDNY